MMWLAVYYVAGALVGSLLTLVFAVAYADEARVKITVRGHRVAALVGLVIGLLAAHFLAHFYIDCDLRAGATSACRVMWL